MTISEVNAMEKMEFLERFGGVYECSPWVAKRVLEMGPFEDFEHLTGQLRKVVEAAGEAERRKLILAHPDLAGKPGVGNLTAESRKEQQGVGLDRLTGEESEVFSGLNAAYRRSFGFPFIICVEGLEQAGITRAFNERLLNNVNDELRTAMDEVHKIARVRVERIKGEFRGKKCGEGREFFRESDCAEGYKDTSFRET
ncbi:MAG: 2-oxo-4-hydroxy-4-carboxy-5-ureidoimidazoline decarboxylase [Armatimonadetes bacterium]|nr:2-oxo-4-hydroxy-4-carboxy-5-ureidoimidazoline decarboxylase [Akkermansiaceae bacterium]